MAVCCGDRLGRYIWEARHEVFGFDERHMFSSWTLHIVIGHRGRGHWQGVGWWRIRTQKLRGLDAVYGNDVRPAVAADRDVFPRPLSGFFVAKYLKIKLWGYDLNLPQWLLRTSVLSGWLNFWLFSFAYITSLNPILSHWGFLTFRLFSQDCTKLVCLVTNRVTNRVLQDSSTSTLDTSWKFAKDCLILSKSSFKIGNQNLILCNPCSSSCRNAPIYDHMVRGVRQPQHNQLSSLGVLIKDQECYYRKLLH